jgi:cytochrome c oxidase subunit 3
MWFNSLNGAGQALCLGLTAVLAMMANWFKDVSAEAALIGLHTKVVAKAHVMGMGLFIMTEVMFFFSVFWAFFHSALAPTVELGSEWPPLGIEAVDPMMIPLLNTALLMSSGATVTFAHHSFFKGDRSDAIGGSLLTLVLAVVFTALQAYEYSVSEFTMSDGAFGSCFYFSTGFHGFHVFVGTLMILVAFARLVAYSVTREHHVGVEAAILYWHFVDVVWVFLYIFVYGWTAA